MSAKSKAHRNKNFEDIFIRFDATQERDRHTDRQTDTACSIGRVYASHRAAKTMYQYCTKKRIFNAVFRIRNIANISV